MPRKRKNKDNVVSLARKTNSSSRYTTEELLVDLLNSEISKDYSKSLMFVFDDRENDGIRSYKFNYFSSGFKDRIELLGAIRLLQEILINEFFE